MSGAMTPAIVKIFCEWESIGLVLTAASLDTRHRTFVHRKNDVWSVTRFTGEKITGHILLTSNEWKLFAGFA